MAIRQSLRLKIVSILSLFIALAMLITACSPRPAAGERGAVTAISQGAEIEETATETVTETATEEELAETGLTASQVGLQLMVEGLTSPLALVPANDGSGRLFVADQIGLVRVIDPGGRLLEAPFLDIRDRLIPLSPEYDERGLLSLAFHPDYASNGRFYVYYSAPLRGGAPPGWDHTSVISEFEVSASDPNQADEASERVILQVDQPQHNHNGGQVVFGPDGYLYISLGDGGGASDIDAGHVEDWYEDNKGGNGQDITQNLLGSILRIDVNQGDPYAVPADNPFVGSHEGLDEIYAYGFRNPFRVTFDSGEDQALYAADAGQNLWEEVSIVTAGGNYGWNVKEGTHCFDAANPDSPLASCPDEAPGGVPLINPVIEYQNGRAADGLGLAVIGGYVYRGGAIPGLRGRYVFGDWSTSFSTGDGALLVATPVSGEQPWPYNELIIAAKPDGRLNEYLLSFGQDAEKELYVLTSGMAGPQGVTGRVYKIVPAPEGLAETPTIAITPLTSLTPITPPATLLPSVTATQEPTSQPGPTATINPNTPTLAPTQVTPPATTEPVPETVIVGVFDDEFQPKALTVPVGTTVIWQVAPNAASNHTVTADGGLFSSGELSAGGTFQFTFTTPGVYPYFCSVHGGAGGEGMAGVITVEG